MHYAFSSHSSSLDQYEHSYLPAVYTWILPGNQTIHRTKNRRKMAQNNSPSRPLGSAISSWKGYERRCVNVPQWMFLWILQHLPWFHGLQPGPVLRKYWTGGNMLHIRHTVHILHIHSFRRICHTRAYKPYRIPGHGRLPCRSHNPRHNEIFSFSWLDGLASHILMYGDGLHRRK